MILFAISKLQFSFPIWFKLRDDIAGISTLVIEGLPPLIWAATDQ